MAGAKRPTEREPLTYYHHMRALLSVIPQKHWGFFFPPTKVITFLREESKAAFLFNLRHSALHSRQPLVWPPFFCFFFANSHRLSPTEQTNWPQHETTQHTGLKISVRSTLGRKKKKNNCGSGPPARLITSLILSPHICGLFNDINNSRGCVHLTFLEELSM